MTITKALLLDGYRDTLKGSGCRPTQLLLCTRETGSIVSWEVRSSKHLLQQFTSIENEVGQPGDYLVFANNYDRILGDPVFDVPA